MRPSMPSMMMSRRAKILVSIVVALIVVIILLFKLAGTYVNYLWFGSVHHHGVFSTMLWTKVVLFFVFGALMALIIGGNLAIAYWVRPPFRPMSPEQQNLQNWVLMIEPRRKLILAVVGVIAFLAAGASAQGDWTTWQLWLNGQSFGVKDPQFHLDISFYAWDYPVYRNLLGFGFTAVIFSLILVVVVHYLSGAIRLQTPGPKITLAARRQITALVFAFMLFKAAAYWLDRYGFVFSQRSKFTGASYTDVHSALPAKTILFWIAIVLAIGVLASIWLRSALLPGIGFVVLLVLSILIGGIYPAIVQQVSVKPNASDKEAPYIKHNIDATRAAYNVELGSGGKTGDVDEISYPATATPPRSAVGKRNATLDNIRILDPSVISPTVRNTQRLAQPYDFSRILDIDRYKVGDSTHDYVVAVRQLAPNANLQGNQNNWINLHTVYTHGYGFVAAQADTDVTNGGQGDYAEGSIPPQGTIGNSQPEVYFGHDMPDYSIVGAAGKKREYNGNNGDDISYGGKGGVPLSSFLTKLSLALDYKETNFVLNDAVGATGAKIILNRDPKKLVEKVAPFLTVDNDTYPFVNSKNGHVMWMVDGYTTMANYPYSQRQSLSDLTRTTLRRGQADTQINYIRNSVKATVDAYDGTVHLYDWDTGDPVLKTWMHVFPGLVEPQSKMPSEVRSHVRYPQDLFDVQRGLLAQYHISKPQDWYNAKGKWAVPSDPFATTTVADQPSYYVLANSPTSSAGTAEYQLTTPMVVNGGQNLAAYISANSDPGDDYGKLSVLTVNSKANVQGPAQVATVFKSNTTISKDINLLNQSQSSVIHGNLLTLPLDKSFLYVEPLYVQGDSSSSYPTLQRVLVTYGDKIGYGATLKDALDDIRLGRATGSSISLGETTGNGGTTTKPPSGSSTSPSPSTSASAPSTSASAPPTSGNPTTGAPGGAVPSTVQQVLAQLDQARVALNKAYDTHDPVKIGQAQKRIDDLLDEYGRLRSSSPP